MPVGPDSQLSKDLPPEVQALGTLTAEFAVAWWRSLGGMVVALVLLLLGTTFAGGSLFGLFATPRPSPPVEGPPGPCCLLFGAAILLFAGIPLLVHAVRGRGLRVLIFPSGLARLQGRQFEVLRWEEIAQLWQMPPEGHPFASAAFPPVFLLLRANGTGLRFDNTLPRIRDLGCILEEETLKYLLPPAIDSFRRGEELRFGTLIVRPQGLACGRKELPWEELDQVTLDEKRGRLVITASGPWWPWSRQLLGKVPNYHVFLALLQWASDNPRR